MLVGVVGLSQEPPEVSDEASDAGKLASDGGKLAKKAQGETGASR